MRIKEERTVFRAKPGELPKWVCSFCFKIYEGDTLPDDWDFVGKSAVCPECKKRAAKDGGYDVVPGGKYATGPDPRAEAPMTATEVQRCIAEDEGLHRLQAAGEELQAKCQEVIARHQNAAGKKLCGLCGYESAKKGRWRCTQVIPKPTIEKYEKLFRYPCPAPNGDCPGFEEKPRKTNPVQDKAPRIEIPAGVRFFHIGRPREGERHQGVMTVAYFIDLRNHVVQIGFSLCSPKDPWVKAKGQELAIHRLLSFPITVLYLYEPRRLVIQIAQALMEHRCKELRSISTGSLGWLSMQIPSWTLDLASSLKVPTYTCLTPRTKGMSKRVQAWRNANLFFGPGFRVSAIQAARETKHG